MLQDAVGEDLVHNAVRERQIAAIGDQILRVNVKLPRHSPSGADALQRRVNPHRTITHAGSRNAPSAPVATDVQENLVVSRGQPEARDGVVRKFSHQMSVQGTVGRADRVLNEGINLASGHFNLGEFCRVASTRQCYGSAALNMCLLDLRQ